MSERRARRCRRRRAAGLGVCVTALAVVGMAVAAGIVHAGEERSRLPGITGADERELMDSTDWPWRAVGRVNRRTGGFCTGTMVGPRHVLTAAHCLWNRRTQDWLPPDSIHFVGGYRRGEYVAEAAVVEIQLAAGARSGPRDPDYHPRNDWAVLTLAADLGDTLGVIPLAVPGSSDPGAPVLQVGYSQDKAHILTVHNGCHFLGWVADQSVLTHNCDATNGDSGSPILSVEGADYRLVGIHVATIGRGDWALGLAIPAGVIRGAPIEQPTGRTDAVEGALRAPVREAQAPASRSAVWDWL